MVPLLLEQLAHLKAQKSELQAENPTQAERAGRQAAWWPWARHAPSLTLSFYLCNVGNPLSRWSRDFTKAAWSDKWASYSRLELGGHLTKQSFHLQLQETGHNR